MIKTRDDLVKEIHVGLDDADVITLKDILSTLKLHKRLQAINDTENEIKLRLNKLYDLP